MKRMTLALAVAVGLLGLRGIAQGALINAGNGLINDTSQNLVWTQDANLAASNTFGLPTGTNLGPYPGDPTVVQGVINADGTMNWPGAMLWIAAMNLANYKGYNDWRLWQVTDPGTPGCSYGYAECGWNLNLAMSELAHLWYGLNNIPYQDTSGIGPQPGWGLTMTGPFANMNEDFYWSDTEVNSALHPIEAWAFDVGSGFQNSISQTYQRFGWAVREGQIATAPLPATGFLMALGLIVLAASRRGQQAILALR